MPQLSNGTTVIVPTGTYQPGTHKTVQNQALQVGQSNCLFTAARNSWPDTGADVLAFTAEISFDAGASWQLLIGFTARGGDVIDPATGLPAPNSFAGFALPQPDNPNRLLRATIQNFVALNTSISITVS